MLQVVACGHIIQESHCHAVEGGRTSKHSGMRHGRNARGQKKNSSRTMATTPEGFMPSHLQQPVCPSTPQQA